MTERAMVGENEKDDTVRKQEGGRRGEIRMDREEERERKHTHTHTHRWRGTENVINNHSGKRFTAKCTSWLLPRLCM